MPAAVLPEAVGPARNQALSILEVAADIEFPVDSANLSDYRNIFQIGRYGQPKATRFGAADGGD
jgi:hypothetical protein